MKGNTVKDIEENYYLELDKVIDNIEENDAKMVLLQFPDGLKQYSVSIVDYLTEKTEGKVNFLIWFGACFGACDTPVGLENLKPGVDLVIQFGHSPLMPSYLDK